MRTLSNLLVFDITKQYRADPDRFHTKKNIYEADSDMEDDEADIIEDDNADHLRVFTTKEEEDE